MVTANQKTAQSKSLLPSQVATFRACLCGLVVLFGSWLTAHGESGILVWKGQPFHGDAAANAVIYSSVESTGPVTRFFSDGQRLSFNTGQFFRYIAFPDRPMTQFTEEADYVEMQRSYQELSAFAEQFTKAAPLLASRLERMADIQKGFKDGKVYYDGKWMPRAEYGNLVTTKKEVRVNKKKEGDAKKNKERKAVYIGILTFGVLLIAAMVLRKWKWAGLLLLIPLAGAGWLTYQENGYEWFKKVPDYLEPPSDWQPLFQKYLEKLNPPK